ncbi:uncharacterized protein LOC133786075 [Humulus lupulus]|uniref:uncharacterized protein LOC133786075 n=1 Tax=Humulus lupulus TaxID=3486 RepID=UPI002B410A2A|nr:uncharacterized protein LOC133786075 [Humulus lupulus]
MTTTSTPHNLDDLISFTEEDLAELLDYFFTTPPSSTPPPTSTVTVTTYGDDHDSITSHERIIVQEQNSIDDDLNLLTTTTTSPSPSPTQPNDAVLTQVHGDLPFISTTPSSPDFPTDSNVRSEFQNSIDDDLNLLTTTTTSPSPSPTQPNDAVSTQVHGDLPFISTTPSSPDFPTDSNCKKSVMRPVFEQPIRVTSFKDLISPKFLTTKRVCPLSELEDDHNSTLQINTNLISSQGNNGTPASSSTTTDNNELVLVEVKRFKPKSIQEICCTCKASKCLKL